MLIPPELCAEIHEYRVLDKHPLTKRRVAIAKVVYRQWQSFDHQMFRDWRTRVVALAGSDETGQRWQHFLPDEYMGRRLGECERYLLQAGPDDEVLTA